VGKGEVLRSGQDLILLAIGSPVKDALEAASRLQEQGVAAAVVNARFVKPLDAELIVSLVAECPRLITVEENALQGGFGSAVLDCWKKMESPGWGFKRLGIPDAFVNRDRGCLRHKYGIDAEGIVRAAGEALKSSEFGVRSSELKKLLVAGLLVTRCSVDTETQERATSNVFTLHSSLFIFSHLDSIRGNHRAISGRGSPRSGPHPGGPRWNDRPIDVPHGHPGRRDGLHVKEVETEGRGKVAHLHVHDEEHAEPQGSKARDLITGTKTGVQIIDDPRRVQNAARMKEDRLNRGRMAQRPRNGEQEFFHQLNGRRSPCTLM